MQIASVELVVVLHSESCREGLAEIVRQVRPAADQARQALAQLVSAV